MNVRHRTIVVALIAAVTLPAVCLAARTPAQETARPQVAIDPQTGRAAGAREMAPEALQALVDRKAPVIIVDVRDEAQFAEETIKGAVHIPFADLEARLKDIPKDTILAFT
jgi:3-mercaptopyruvate sulfurtransferase SseA